MVKRIVCMELAPEAEGRFLDIFESVKHEIRKQKGCLDLELLRSADNNQVYIWTISLWQSADDLETYRSSPLFRKTWSEVKPLFTSRARAWTLTPYEWTP